MDHKDQHHLKHVKEREQEKKEHQKHEQEAEKSRVPFHPAWLFMLGAALMLVAILVWSLLLSRP
jgi:type VI protein secretion system component VasF